MFWLHTWNSRRNSDSDHWYRGNSLIPSSYIIQDNSACEYSKCSFKILFWYKYIMTNGNIVLSSFSSFCCIACSRTNIYNVGRLIFHCKFLSFLNLSEIIYLLFIGCFKFTCHMCFEKLKNVRAINKFFVKKRLVLMEFITNLLEGIIKTSKK